MMDKLRTILEEIEDLDKRFNFRKDFVNKDKVEDEEPKKPKVEEDPILRKIKQIKDGEASLEELEKLIKEKE